MITSSGAVEEKRFKKKNESRDISSHDAEVRIERDHLAMKPAGARKTSRLQTRRDAANITTGMARNTMPLSLLCGERNIRKGFNYSTASIKSEAVHLG